MAAGTKVQLRLGDRVVAEVAFRGDELRIGRMKENDLVINNLAVSRFHAVLRRVGEAFEIEDLGSENGSFVNGIPVRGTALVPNGAELTIGKHVLTIRAAGGGNTQPPSTGRSDVWDAAQTYFAPDLAPRAAIEAGLPSGHEPMAPHEPEDEVVAAEALEEGAELVGAEVVAIVAARAPATSLDLPDPEGLFAFGDEDVAMPAPLVAALAAPEFDVSAPEAAALPVRTELGGQTALFDFGATNDLGLSDPSLARAAAAKLVEPPSTAATPLYAGVIVARGGKVERVVPFRGDDLMVGRSPRCAVMLATAGVSRRHARIVREGESFRVLDLGSANGIRVNGELTGERLLQLGDVIGIDDYTLTFVLDRQPLDEAVRSAPAAPIDGTPGHMTVLHSAPFSSMPERDLVTASDEDDLPLDVDKRLEIATEVVTAAPAKGLLSERTEWVVEVVLATDALPPALRDVLRELDAEELCLPAQLRLRRRA